MLPEEPLVSIVTPCMNTATFLEETIRSVLDQDYPRIEYLVMDGGSTDGTLQILNRYAHRLRFVSEPDAGQADAVNRGLALAHGDILAFLNADDTYLPGAVAAAVAALTAHPDAAVAYGDAWYVDEQGRRVGAYPVAPFTREHLARRCFICQPAAFFRRDAFLAVGGLDASLRYALDYDLWVRLARDHVFVQVDSALATFRLHASAKTVRETQAAMRETLEVLHRHYGYVPFNWIYGYSHQKLTGQALAMERPRAAFSSVCYSLALGVTYNWRQPLRYCHDVIDTAMSGLA